MTDEEIEKIGAVFAKQMANIQGLGQHPACEFCQTEERRKTHRQEHEFVQGLMKIADRWEGVRWGVLRELLKGISWVLITATVLGLVFLVAKSGGVSLK